VEDNFDVDRKGHPITFAPHVGGRKFVIDISVPCWPFWTGSRTGSKTSDPLDRVAVLFVSGPKDPTILTSVAFGALGCGARVMNIGFAVIVDEVVLKTEGTAILVPNSINCGGTGVGSSDRVVDFDRNNMSSG